MIKLPSKKLLSEILGYDVHNYSHNGVPITNLAINVTEREDNFVRVAKQNINIYELAHKCKEWASANGYILQSYITEDFSTCFTSKDGQILERINEKTEPETIFKACNSIFEVLAEVQPKNK